MRCNLCPRMCNMDRKFNINQDTDNNDTHKGFCQMPQDIYLARAALHMWEEPCISGENGSGAVFFTGCQLRCVFCQNYNIAAGRMGKKVSVERLAEIFLELQAKNANNINLVTPTHYVPSIIKALEIAKNQGLNIPIVYNTSAYENVNTLKSLEGLIDIYLPDLKYVSKEASAKYSNAPDYFEVATRAISEMYRQTGKPQFNEAGIMLRGMIVRHLMLPSLLNDTKAVIKYLYDTYKDNCYISIMNQYTPLKQVEHIKELNRRITKREYNKVIDYAIDLGVENAFIQQGGTSKESFIPEFNYEGV